MSEKMPITPRGLAKLEEELKDLKQVQRPSVIQAISEARGLGDLSENAEYHSAKERQAFIEGRIAVLEDAISSAYVIDPAKMGGDSVKFGATVRVADAETGQDKTYQIVGKEEADIGLGLIAFDSPLARALIDRMKGDEVTFASPRGTREFELLSVEYK
jgi:transcription elongation factor GreA